MRTSADGRLLCVSCDDQSIKIWDTKTLQEITEIEPGFSGGRERIAIEPKTSLLVSGTWEDGLTCYDYSVDRVSWRRDDLIGIQAVALSPAFESSVFVAVEAPDYRVDEPGIFSGVVELDIHTGQTKWQADEAESIYLHPRIPVLVLTSRANRLVRILDASRKQTGSIPMIYFAVLDVAFKDNLIALAEGQKGARLIELSGQVLFCHCPTSRQPNCLNLAFEGDVLNIIDSWDNTFVTRLDATGRILHEYTRDNHTDVCFIRDGGRFVDSYGNVCFSSDGRLDARINV
jgi:WD40 repeat protein